MDEMFLAVLNSAVQKQNLTLDLYSIPRTYVSAFNKLVEEETSPESQGYQITTNEKKIHREKKKLIKTFKKFVKLGFIEVIESKSGTSHVVNIVPVWEKEKK